MTDLNLGCGWAYRPGYLNIDSGKRSVADVIADAGDLPFESSIIDTIEAIQLLEHFDLVHCKYVLSEWFRVLKPGGMLSIETPDLEASLKNLSSRKQGKSAASVQWLFGIDSPGLQHKGGFTFGLLEETLAEVGYESIKKRPASTHTYAPGFRAECVKPVAPGASQFLASLRKRIRRQIGTDDSFVLIPFEEELSRIKSRIHDVRALDKDRVQAIVSSISVCSPHAAIAFLEECFEAHLLDERELEKNLGVLYLLSKMRFHEKVLTLWLRSRKDLGSEREFETFVDRTAEIVRQILVHPESAERLLEYIASLDPTPIEFFGLCLIRQKASLLRNLGVLRFHNGDLQKAEESFSESLRFDPQNPLAHWNLARIGIAAGRPSEIVSQHYMKSFAQTNNPQTRARLDEERHAYDSEKKGQIRTTPVSDYDFPQ